MFYYVKRKDNSIVGPFVDRSELDETIAYVIRLTRFKKLFY